MGRRPAGQPGQAGPDVVGGGRAVLEQDATWERHKRRGRRSTSGRRRCRRRDRRRSRVVVDADDQGPDAPVLGAGRRLDRRAGSAALAGGEKLGGATMGRSRGMATRVTGAGGAASGAAERPRASLASVAWISRESMGVRSAGPGGGLEPGGGEFALGRLRRVAGGCAQSPGGDQNDQRNEERAAPALLVGAAGNAARPRPRRRSRTRASFAGEEGDSSRAGDPEPRSRYPSTVAAKRPRSGCYRAP